MILPAAATNTYDTYTYDYSGSPRKTPDAYMPRDLEQAHELDALNMKDPSDLFVDAEENVYIADTGNNRIIILDAEYNVKQIITEFATDDPALQNTKTFSSPSGLFVDTNGDIYIADTGNGRLVVLDKEYTFLRVIGTPDVDFFVSGATNSGGSTTPDASTDAGIDATDTETESSSSGSSSGSSSSTTVSYKPVAVSVDSSGRIYVISQGCNQGVIALTSSGQFESFLGAQKVKISVFDAFWRLFMTDEQKARSVKFVPTEYNNIAIDKDGFLYITTNSIDIFDQITATLARDRSSNYAPIKRLSADGTDVLKRNGFFPPSGDVEITHPGTTEYNPSSIIDVAVTKNGQYSLLDGRRNKIFTYDEEGTLLYAFGKSGSQKGTFTGVSALDYKGTDILVLDKLGGSLTVFYRTEYGDTLALAQQLQAERKYTEAEKLWQEILNQNINVDIAHQGIGKALYRQERYEEAAQYFKNAKNLDQYSLAYAEYRKQVIRDNFWIIALVVAAVVAVLVVFFKLVKKVNRRGPKTPGKTTLVEELCYGFQFIFRPFRGSWELIREKRGSLRGAMVILALTVFTFIFKANVTGYIFGGFSDSNTNVIMEALTVLLPFLLWCVANWSLTTLADGEGSFKSIVITTAYSLLPLSLINIPLAIISNFMVQTEAQFYSFFVGLAMVWMVLLLFVGMMTIHDYELGKNVIISICTIIAMLFIAFLGMLFVNLVQRMISFVISLYQELAFRL